MFRPFNLNLAGAAIATTIAQYVGTIYLLNTIYKGGKVSVLRFPKESLRVLSKTIPSIVSANVAMLCRTFSLLGCWAVATSVCTRLGEAHVAVHQLVLSLFLVFSFLGESISVAGQVLIARHMTLGQRVKARQLIRRLARFAVDGFG